MMQSTVTVTAATIISLLFSSSVHGMEFSASSSKKGAPKLPLCTKLEDDYGNTISFNAGYGSCQTYSDFNADYCDFDYMAYGDGGVRAIDACPECGECEKKEASCPATAPNDGDYCDWQEAGFCEYDEIFCCGESGGFSSIALCSPDGQAMIAPGSIYCGDCNEEPTPVCPATEPSAGDFCNWQELGSCEYDEIFCCGESAGFSTFAHCSADGEVTIAQASMYCGDCE